MARASNLNSNPGKDNMKTRTVPASLAILLLLVAAPTAAQFTAPPAIPGQSAPSSSLPGQTAPPSSLPAPTAPSSSPTVTAPPSSPGSVQPIFQQPPSSLTKPGLPVPPRGTAPTTAPAAPALASPAPAPGPVPFDYNSNLQSDVFGANLFTGAFAASKASIFNPDHLIAIGDQLQVRLWGAFTFEGLLTVDPQGNIFLPQVGPVNVVGIPNKDLQQRLESALRRTFRSNVYSYISLAGAQPVRIFVTGAVPRPGMYEGTSTDSILRYLDQAGGIDLERGSFLDVRVMRGSQARAEFNLYDFLLNGQLPGIQLGNGDVILVQPRKSMYKVMGLAENAKRFEFTGAGIEIARLVALARPLPAATHVRLYRVAGVVRNVEYYALNQVTTVKLGNGDEVEFTSDQRPGTITVRVEGEHASPQEYALPYGSRLGDLMRQIEFIPSSDSENLQLFRLSVKERQRALLQASLKSLESAVLTARSGTTEEARLRTDEAALMMQWVERARNLEPLGQVVVAQNQHRNLLLLENGDVLRVPVKNGLVLVQGEVLFPNAVAFDPQHDVDAYIKRAGGYTQTADASRIIIAHRDGSYDEAHGGGTVRPGDDILVLPKVDSKPRQFWRDIVQIIFQVALAAKVVLNN
jgi:protein involved in polysaccharide export with SLBB domain